MAWGLLGLGIMVTLVILFFLSRIWSEKGSRENNSKLSSDGKR